MTVAERVFEAIRNDILTGEIVRNELISIYQLAEKYGVSRTPVREAVLKLSGLGLVDVEKNLGVKVKGLAAADIKAIFQTRIMLEVPSVFYAATSNPPGVRKKFAETLAELELTAKSNEIGEFIQVDRKLNELIIAWNGNYKAAKVAEQIRDEALSLGVNIFKQKQSMTEVLEEHMPVYVAILNGDGKAAANLLKDHLLEIANILLQKSFDEENLVPDAEFTDDRDSFIFIGL